MFVSKQDMDGGRMILVDVSSEWEVLLQGRGENDAIACVRAIS